MLAGLVAILSIKRAAVGATFDPEISIQALVTISLAQKRLHKGSRWFFS